MSEIRVNTFKAEDGISAPSFPNGIQVTGVVTATSLASSVPHLNVGDNIQLGAAGVTTATTFVGALSGNATGLSGTPNITVGSVVASTGTFSGNVSIGGTLTYEDVLNIDSVGIVTAREGVFIPDSKIIKLGNTAGSPDMRIHHDGNHSIVEETGTGNLFLKTNGSEIAFLGDGGSDYMVRGIQNAATELYYNASKKFETTNTGAVVTGIMTATSVSDSIGDVRKLGMNAQSGNYTLVASDSGKFIRRTGGNITINPSVFSTGDMVTILNDDGSSMTIIQGSSFSLINTADASTGNRTVAQRGLATILFNAQNQGYISGSGIT